MIRAGRSAGIALVCALLLAGCGRLAPRAAFDDVAAEVGARIGKRVNWDMGTSDDLAARAAVRGMLSRELTPASAVQIALLNSRELQAAYADVGIAQAQLVQAGLLKNPVFDGAVTWFNDAGGTPNLAFGVAWSFVDLLRLPRRKAVARSALEEAKLEVARRVIVHAADTHAAFIDHVAARQEVELLGTVVGSARASVEAAAALRKAGNITALQFEQNQSFLTGAKLELARAEARAAETREKLNVLMGLSGGQTRWAAPSRLPKVPSRLPQPRDLERRAVEHSLEIALARQRLVTLGRQFRLVRQQSLLPDLDVGGEYSREVEVNEEEVNGQTVKEKEIRKEYGPKFELAIPIFDRGQARRAGALLKLRKAEDELWAIAVKVRSAARLARARLATAEKTVHYYRSAVLPQSARLLRETQRGYNAMQESIFQLITARRQQILAGRQSIQAQRVYWLAHVRLHQLLSGTLPGAAEAPGVALAAMADANNGGDH